MPSKYKKLVRERMAKTGESWATAARHVRAQTGLLVVQPPLPPRPPTMPNQPRFRHVYLERATEYEIDVFTVNQEVSFFIAKFDTGWSAARHWLEPVYHHAIWAMEDNAECTDDELCEFSVRAIQNVRRDGYVLVVHAPGRIAMMWSDHDVPRELYSDIKAKFGPSMKAIGQPIVDGPPPPWWPDTLDKGIPSPIVCVTEQTRNDGGKKLIARCTLCGAHTAFDALADHPSLPNINWPMLSRAIEANFDGRQLDLRSLRREEEVEIAAILSNLVPSWRNELRHQSNGGCTHV